ncbi:MAG: hypothetical protein JNG88_08660 [Phycisphaerales bacterium]|nr:hypothetical protein [Phycisphaerales bacterium]
MTLLSPPLRAQSLRFIARVAAIGVALVLCACDRSPSGVEKGTPQQPRDVIPTSATPPVYSFAPGLAKEHPEAVGFVRSFLDICLAGDYTAYRGLVARSRQPEPRERFEAIYRAMRTVQITAIESVDLRDLPSPAYRIVTNVEFDPESRVALRGANRDVAILIFREEGEWRMLPAPAGLQPDDEEATTQPAETTSQVAVDYPWDVDGDY